MSGGLYNMVNGVNPVSKLLCKLLDIDWDKIERFRDAGIDMANGQIWIYTRTGGNNREIYQNEELTSNKYFVNCQDDSFDNTYATFNFDINKLDESKKQFLDLVVGAGLNKERPNWEKTFDRMGV